MALDADTVTSFVDTTWDDQVDGTLRDYIRIPNVSPAYDPDWVGNGHMDRAVELLRQWCAARAADLPGTAVEVHELAGRTPVILVDVPATGDGAGHGAGNPAPDEDVVLLYGHLDKQPPFEGWREGLGPWTPVVEGDRLYGRGGADDGYAVFSALTAIAAVRAAGGAHARCLILIEASEESGSPDLPAHLDALGGRLGLPSLLVGLDSGCGDWERLWVTTSLRGLVNLSVRVDVLTEGVHSGNAGGIVPSSFRILRGLLDRIEDPATGRIRIPELAVDVPELRRAQAVDTGAELGDIAGNFPFVAGVRADCEDPGEQILARTWRPTLEVVGLDGAPPVNAAGNVLRPSTAAKLSFRIPPTADPGAAEAAIVTRLSEDPPRGAAVTVTPEMAEAGWHAPEDPAWLAAALDGASRAAFGQSPRAMGEGGTIPFMGMLGRRFPAAQFVVTGVLGPGSNAHGPNESLHLPAARRVTASVAHVLDAHANRPG